MAGQGGGAAGGEEAVAVVEAVHELVDVEDAHADGGEFDGEGETVQAVAQAGHGGAVVRGEAEAGDDRGGPVGEQREGRIARGGGEVAVRVGHRQGPHLQQVLLDEPEPVPAGGEDADALGAAQQGRGELRARPRQMLAVVDDEQQPPVPHLLDEDVQRRLRRVVVQPQRVGGGERHERRVVQSGEVHEAHAVREGPLYPGRDARGEPGLADAARPGQRHQPCAGQQFASLGQFATPVDEAGRLDRQLVVPSWR